MKKLAQRMLADPAQEQVRQEHAAAIRELQSLPLVSARVIRDVVLVDGVVTPVPHGLGRPAIWVRESCPRNPSTTGRVEEVRTGSHNRNQVVALMATGWGASITVDILVV